MEKLQRGQIFMNTLEYFNKLEVDPLRSDPCEGSAWQMQMSDGASLSIQSLDKTWVPIEGVTSLRYSHPKDLKTNIYCTYGVFEETAITGLDTAAFGFGDTFVAITEPNTFLGRIAAAAKSIGQEIDWRPVEYIDESNYHGLIGPFRKRNTFAYQSEFRIVMFPGFGSSRILEIGNIQDISIIGSLPDLPGRMQFS